MRRPWSGDPDARHYPGPIRRKSHPPEGCSAPSPIRLEGTSVKQLLPILILPILSLLAAAVMAPPALAQARDLGWVAASADAPPPAGTPPAEGTPPADGTPPPDEAPDRMLEQRSGRADLRAQLEAAQRRLEEAARQVAELSAQMGQPLMRQFSALAEPPGRAVIGVQLDPSGGKNGVRVLDVSPGGPAEQAGIRAGDTITAVNGIEVKGDDAARHVVDIVRDVKPDGKVSVRVLRDGKARELTVVARPAPGIMSFRLFPGAPGLPVPPEPPAFAANGQVFGAAPLGPMGPLFDMELVTLTPRLGSYFGTDKGVLVARAPAHGALKLEDGDVILSIDGRAPTSGAHATRILASYQPGEKIGLEIMRERKMLSIATTMPRGGPGDPRAFYFRSGKLSVPGRRGKVVILDRKGEAI